MIDTIVVVGASLAGAKTAEGLREGGYAGRLVLVGEEPHRPYERPPLSKGYLAGSADRDSVFVHSPGWYAEHDVELRTGVHAAAIDRDAREVRLASGDVLGYDRLVLATGSTPVRLPVPGADAAGVLTLRTLDDCEHLRRTLGRVERLVIVGAGWIGLEAAAAARSAGVAVTVVEAAAQPLLAVLGPELAPAFTALHERHGVEFRFGATVTHVDAAAGSATGVTLSDGTRVAADAVLVGIGVRPNVELASDAGLAVENGVLVDASLRTSDPAIWAVGDIANAWHPSYKQRIRVEHWANALNQPAVAAAAMLGQPATYDRLPYFFTDQYDLGMEYVGFTGAGFDDVVIRGAVESGEYIAFWRSAGRVVAGMNVNVWDVVDPIRALIMSRAEINAARLADPAVPLESLVP